MGRAGVFQEYRRMRFDEIHGRYRRGCLSQAEAALALGVCERTFRRWGERFEAEGADGLYDRRLGRVSKRAAPADEVARLLSLFDTKYSKFNTRHLYEHLVDHHACTRSYNWVRLKLQEHGRIKPVRRGGAHRRKRDRQPLPGMMLHQDASDHAWVPGVRWDLVVTMDDATSEILSAFFVEEEGTMSSLIGMAEAIAARGLPSSLYTDRGSHYWNTPAAGGKVDKDNPTQFGRAMRQLGITMIAAYSPQARGVSERMFGTLQGRLPQELALAGITEMAAANRFLKQDFLPRHNQAMMKPAAAEGTAFVPCPFDVTEIFCEQEDRVVGNDNTVRWRGLTLQIPQQAHRLHYVKASVRVHHYPDQTLAIFAGPRCLARYEADGRLKSETLQQKQAA